MYNELVPEDYSYLHSYEGSDDMPGHGKCVLLGTDITLPITDGKLNIGEDQAICLNEHRDGRYSRSVAVTISGALYSE